ncbi:hypothetical protein OAB57_00955 [Bacteriovoracaceae bacterium]|nr:hypothetical protein [Bacteriovoracaceae bacterium]
MKKNQNNIAKKRFKREQKRKVKAQMISRDKEENKASEKSFKKIISHDEEHTAQRTIEWVQSAEESTFENIPDDLFQSWLTLSIKALTGEDTQETYELTALFCTFAFQETSRKNEGAPPFDIEKQQEYISKWFFTIQMFAMLEDKDILLKREVFDASFYDSSEFKKLEEMGAKLSQEDPEKQDEASIIKPSYSIKNDSNEIEDAEFTEIGVKGGK